MGQKDKTEKLLEDYNDVFADIINVLLFNGENKILPDALEEAKLKSQYKADDNQLHEVERDIAKYWKEKNTTIALYGLENQTEPERVMPVRVIGYDGANYRSQLLKKNENDLYPVVTIVLYFGKERWNQPRNLKDVIHIPDELAPYVNDYKIHVFEISWLTEEQVNMFQSDFRIVAEFFTQIRKNNSYQPTKKEIDHVDEVLKLLSVFGGEEHIADFKLLKETKGEKNMAGVIDRMIDEAALKAEVRGRASEFLKNLENLLMNNSQLTLENALRLLGKSTEEYENAKKLLDETVCDIQK